MNTELEVKRNDLILKIAPWWQTACEFADDETYEKVIKIMETAICTDAIEGLDDASDRLLTLIPIIELSQLNSARNMLFNWANRKRDVE